MEVLPGWQIICGNACLERVFDHTAFVVMSLRKAEGIPERTTPFSAVQTSFMLSTLVLCVTSEVGRPSIHGHLTAGHCSSVSALVLLVGSLCRVLSNS